MTVRRLRSDALRNREKLLVAAAQLFTERGLDVPLEEIAHRANVSIGTLYNHFPTRGAFHDAIFPERLAALDRILRTALEADDPWDGFTGYLHGLFTLHAEDRSLNDAMAQRLPVSDDVHEACRHFFEQSVCIVERAKESGGLRADFELKDLLMLVGATSQLIQQSADWQRFLSFYVDGLR
ncbi:TetR/AcrR family transcriptional regulator [Streptomyces sp. AS02]|uniref:TetR/AcrR family transcriptional regulator n=1 Tax=Streptomyces sp. AS02 TaxID=2938946 RepID=UPI00202096EE|nr:TetR/AcrR family transcriptional regulator [Streptomyces sp. AS02]MCL8011273.1 TetR/AcrR family transcriptional regulator [Streptomyces sp. AS02]